MLNDEIMEGLHLTPGCKSRFNMSVGTCEPIVNLLDDSSMMPNIFPFTIFGGLNSGKVCANITEIEAEILMDTFYIRFSTINYRWHHTETRTLKNPTMDNIVEMFKEIQSRDDGVFIRPIDAFAITRYLNGMPVCDISKYFGC